MLKGSTPTLIFAVLAEAPGHGYAIARRIQALSEDALSLGDGLLYPALRALEQRELILGEWKTTPAGPARRIYRITPAGAALATRVMSQREDNGLRCF